MHETFELKREVLYEAVWSEPMSALAQKYSLSDVGLAKICRKLKIPFPGRGYWQKEKMDKPPLPPLKFGDTDTYTPFPLSQKIEISLELNKFSNNVCIIRLK